MVPIVHAAIVILSHEIYNLWFQDILMMLMFYDFIVIDFVLID